MFVSDSTDTSTASICAKVKQSLSPLGMFSRLFSLNCAGGEHPTDPTQCHKIYTVMKAMVTAGLLGYLNFYTLFIKIQDHNDHINISIKLTDAIQMCYDYFQYLVDLFFVFQYGSRMNVFYQQYANVDLTLGISDYSPIKRRLVIIIIFFMFIWLLTSAVDFSGWVLSYGFYTPTLYSVGYIFLFIKMLNILDLISHVMHIEYRLTFMKDQLQECYNSTNTLRDDFNDPFCSGTFLYPKLLTPSKSKIPSELVIVGRNNHQIVKWICRCYLLLIEQCAFINQMLGMRILLNSLSLLIDMIRHTNIAVRLIIGSQVTIYYSGYYPAVANLLRMSTCAVMMASLVAHCERAYRQADATLAIIDHTLFNKDPDGDLRAALLELRGLIQNRRIDFHMAYFFRLDYSLLVSTASVVVTYTIILLQNLPN